jgi:hypothetical protein
MNYQPLFDKLYDLYDIVAIETEMDEIIEAVKECQKPEPIETIEPLTTIDEIVNAVCKSYNIDPGLVRLRTNKREIVEPRQLCMTLLVFMLKMRTANAGKEMGGFDHATVLNGIRRVSERYQTYTYYRDSVKLILSNLCKSLDEVEYVIDRINNPRIYALESLARVVSNLSHNKRPALPTMVDVT